MRGVPGQGFLSSKCCRFCMAETFPCPVCGKDENRRGEKFTDGAQTKAHIDGAHDEAHKDVSPSEVDIAPKAAPDGGESSDGGTAPSSPDAGGSEPAESSGESGNSSAVFRPAGEQASAETADKDDEDDGIGIAGIVVGLFILLVILGGNGGSSSRAGRPR